jgi:hypothetical protein
VRLAVDHDTARTADALAAVVVERDRVVAGQRELLVQHVEHLQERHVLADALDAVRDHRALALGVLLTPDPHGDVHL